jgi:predicted helicase
MADFTRAFNDAVTKNNVPNDELKWHRELVKLAKKQEKTNIRLGFDPKRIICSLYRPYFQEYFYNDRFIISMNFLQQDIFAGQNASIVVSGIGANQPFSCLATTILPSHDLL